MSSIRRHEFRSEDDVDDDKNDGGGGEDLLTFWQTKRVSLVSHNTKKIT